MKKYGILTLIWYKPYETMESEIAREKAIKEWQRKWKIELIKKHYPKWKCLYDKLV
jgi:putative endonuclease